jgi:hypothetical protein
VTPPRIVNGPTLLTGLATSASCGAGLRHAPAESLLCLLQLCRLSSERKICLPWSAYPDGQARRPHHRKRQGTPVHARKTRQYPRVPLGTPMCE